METNICSLIVGRLITVEKKSIQLKHKCMFFRPIIVFFDKTNSIGLEKFVPSKPYDVY